MTIKAPFNGKLKNTTNLFIPFIMAGDPSPSFTVEFAYLLQEEGADILELGIPYSDPLADGPVIQRSAARALKQGMTLKKAIELVPRMRERGLTIPVVLFTYYNPVHQFGEESLLRTLHKNGIDGLLIPDLPFEESRELKEQCQQYNIEWISLAAPNSEKRIKQIAREATGFLYGVSSLGVTGERESFSPEIQGFIKQLKTYSNVPVAIGFGISSHDQIASVNQYADGVIIGSKIIRIIEEHLPDVEAPDTLTFTSILKEIRYLLRGE
ncbi:MAG: tryptophan synthase subunit alpha [Bacillaceae bacterium]|nr:tryptophan synthase subunit alpha [Bacillaceae bacterium]